MNHAHTLCAAAAIAASGAAANASLYQWNFDRAVGGDGSYGINDNGGTIERVFAEFDSSTNRLLWEVTFSDQVTEGFTLAVNDGPNPKGHAGELALLFFDASDKTDPRVTAYGYNGKNSASSFKDGDGNTSGNQVPDRIFGANTRSMFSDMSAIDTPDGKRILSFEMDATILRDHTPAYANPEGGWYGIGFAEQLGLWMHPFRNFDATYDADGFISSFSKSGEGWFDGKEFTTVPTPGSAALALIGAVMFGPARRRR